MPRLVLIDGYAHVFKAFFGLKQQLTTAAGIPTAAVLGFVNMFTRLRKEHPFDHVAVVFDAPGPTFRDDIFPEYKANRPPAPKELIIQAGIVRRFLAAMKVQVLESPGYEADDIIATLALRAVESGGEALVVSVDKDLLQIVRPGVTILRDHLGKVELLDTEGVKAKLGVTPAQVPDYLGLIGDTSDNIPGVPGVGPKTAVKLLEEFGDAEAVFAAAPSMKPSKMRDNLVQFAERGRLSRQLAILKTDFPCEFSWERFAWSYEPGEELRSLFAELEFRSFLAALPGQAPQAPKPEIQAARVTDYGIIETVGALEAACAEIRAAGLAAIDTETTGLETLDAELVGISLSWRKNQGRYVSIRHTGTHLTLEDVRRVLGPLLASPDVRWVAHHWHYDYKILLRHGFPVGTIWFDTLLAAYITNPDKSGKGLKKLSVECLGIQMTEIKSLIGEGDDLASMASVDVEEAGNYACADADVTLQLCHHFLPLVESAGLMDLLQKVEQPLTPVLSRMEFEGVRIDQEHFAKMATDAARQLDVLTREAIELAGRPFNLNSPKQVGEILFTDLGLSTGKKVKTGFSTDASVLEDLAKVHPFPKKMLEYREVEKLRSTYLLPLPRLVHPSTGRLHTHYSQTTAATGRLASDNPNLQNIPILTEAGREIRRGFLPSPGRVLLSADYSQIELRILAHVAKDPALIAAFQEGQDIHTLTASKVLGVAPGDVTKLQRSQAKAINFGIVYGMTAFRLAADLGIPRVQAGKFIDDYFAAYAGVKTYMTETAALCAKQGFVTTLLGRRRYIPDINSPIPTLRNQAERIAINTPIQGTAADMIKLAMLAIDKQITAEGLASRMILQVHDELIFDVEPSELERLKDLVRTGMEGAMPLSVPIKVDMEVGDNWAET